MSIFWIITTLVAMLTIAVLLRVRRRYLAAMNVLMAKYTFERLSHRDQAKVKDQAKAIALQHGLTTQGYDNDVARFGWYALGMKVLGIASKLPENPHWYVVKNPSKALKPNDAFLNTASQLIRKNYAIDLRMN
jgi:hypothetical protein